MRDDLQIYIKNRNNWNMDHPEIEFKELHTATLFKGVGQFVEGFTIKIYGRFFLKFVFRFRHIDVLLILGC